MLQDVALLARNSTQLRNHFHDEVQLLPALDWEFVIYVMTADRLIHVSSK